MSWFKRKSKKTEESQQTANLPRESCGRNFTRYSQEKAVNVIPEEDFTDLVLETFDTICQTLRCTYGPYGSPVMISEQTDNSTTKDGFKTVESLQFSNPYQRLVYLAIKKICERVNTNVGDGTTTCILLANELYKRLLYVCTTPDDKRDMFNYLNKIEAYLTENSDEFDSKNNLLTPLNKENFTSIIGVASNYDEEMMEVLTKAFDPQYDTAGNVTSMRSIITDQRTDSSQIGVDKYKVDYLPGDYRLGISMAEDFALALATKSKVRVVIYDHKFNHSDWMNFYKDYDRTTSTLVIARSYTSEFINEDYKTYLKQMALVKQPATIFFASIDSYHAKTDLEDLAAVLNTDAHPLSFSYAINHEELPEAIVSVYNETCLCFYDLKEPPKEYIRQLRSEIRNNKRMSNVDKRIYERRISDLSFEHQDSLVTVTCESSLESKFVADKIDDCVHIIESAFNTGVVPNSFQYGVRRINHLNELVKDDANFMTVVRQFYVSLREMLRIIYVSKYPTYDLDEYNNLLHTMDNAYLSYNVIKDELAPSTEFCTSAQYDLEVMRAAISIVKYLLTTKAFIFDAHLLPPQLPNGYIPQ